MPAQSKKFHENQYLGEVWQLEGAAQLRVVGPRQPIRREGRHGRGAAVAAPQFGAGE